MYTACPLHLLSLIFLSKKAHYFYYFPEVTQNQLYHDMMVTVFHILLLSVCVPSVAAPQERNRSKPIHYLVSLQRQGTVFTWGLTTLGTRVPFQNFNTLLLRFPSSRFLLVSIRASMIDCFRCALDRGNISSKMMDCGNCTDTNKSP